LASLVILTIFNATASFASLKNMDKCMDTSLASLGIFKATASLGIWAIFKTRATTSLGSLV